MTWKSAKHLAGQYLAKMNLPPSLNGVEIRLTDYETDADLKFLKSANEWSLAFHRMVNGAIARELRRKGAKVIMVKIRMSDYFAWLAKQSLDNTTANRALFISEMSK